MRLRHWTIPLLYAAGATVWIFATDGVVDALSTDKDTLQSLQLLKGLLFVVLSAALLALFVQRERRAREALERHVDEQRVLTQLVQRCEDLSRSATTTRALTQAVCEAVREVEGIDSVLVRIGMGSVSRALAEALAEAVVSDDPNPVSRLSHRELEVIRLIAQGRSLREIALELNLSEKTIGTYRARLGEKLGLKTNVDLTRFALQHQLIDAS